MSGFYVILFLAITYKTRINETGKKEINLIIINLLRSILLPCIVIFGLTEVLIMFLSS